MGIANSGIGSGTGSLAFRFSVYSDGISGVLPEDAVTCKLYITVVFY